MSEQTQTVEDSENNPETQSAENAESTALRAEIEELKRLILANKPVEKQEAKPDLAEIYKTDPVRAIEMITEQKVKSQAGVFTKEQQKFTYDAKAEAEFPHLKSDPEFQKLVKANIQDMVQSGEYGVDSPRLVYRAAQIAALKYKPKASQTKASGSNSSSEAPSSVQSSKKHPADSQFEAMSKMFGIKNVDKMRDRWESHKGSKK